MSRAAALLSSLSLLLACEAQRDFPAEDVAAFEETLAATHEAQGAVGTVMRVESDEGERWTGYAGAEAIDGAPTGPSTRFRTASAGKTFTGALILALQDEGALSVDDAVSAHVDLVPNGDAITLRMLLQHTSGIANYTHVAAYHEAVAAGRRLTYEELVEACVAEEPDFPPGTDWNYSNTGYILLGIIAEQIVGRPIEDELHARFFEPLGMRDTHPYDATTDVWTGYVSHGGELEAVGPPAGGYPADGGAWVTSLDDLVTWARAFFGGRLHRPETLAAAQVPAGGALLRGVAQSFGLEDGGYGLGLVVGTDATFGPLLAGAGNGDGARTFVAYLPDQRLTFAVAVDVGDGSVPIVETLSAAGPMLDTLRDRAAAGTR